MVIGNKSKVNSRLNNMAELYEIRTNKSGKINALLEIGSSYNKYYSNNLSKIIFISHFPLSFHKKKSQIPNHTNFNQKSNGHYTSLNFDIYFD